MTSLAEFYNNNPLSLNINDVEAGIYSVNFDSMSTSQSLPIVNRATVKISGDPDNGHFAGKKVEVPFFLTDGEGTPKEVALQQYKRFLLATLGSEYQEDWQSDNDSIQNQGPVPLKMTVTKREFKGRELTNVIFEYDHSRTATVS